MTLLVRAPPRYEPERRYVLDVVLSGWLGLEWRLIEENRTDVLIQLTGDPTGRGVTLPDDVFGTPTDRWLTPGSLPSSPLPWRPVGRAGSDVLDPEELLPVLYGSTSEPHLVHHHAQGIRLAVDVFGSAFVLLTRYEEAMAGARDTYGRFPAASGLAAREGFLGLPLVDAYVELLSAVFGQLWPRLTPRHRSYAVLLTHDVDDPLSTVGRRPVMVARQLAGDLVRRRDPGLFVRRTRAVGAARRGNLDPDPHNTFDFLMDVSDRHGLRSAFYFLSDNRVDPDADPNALIDHPWVRRLVGHVHRRGHEVGFHAGFDTYRDPGRTAAEFTHLRRIAESEGVEQERWGGRQHYLQWTNPLTWRNWDDAGLSYDCTLAFSEAVGFRTGTAREYPVFDLLARRALGLRERPFQIMDVTLFRHMSLSPGAAQEQIMRIAHECRRFRGTLGVLWHNDEVLRTASEKRWYEALVDAVTRPV